MDTFTFTATNVSTTIPITMVETRSSSDRARDLLMRHLKGIPNDGDGERFGPIAGPYSGRKYYIFLGCGIYDLVGDHWHGHCIDGIVVVKLPNGNDHRVYVPKDDTLLACLLLIKYDEPTFIKIANRSLRGVCDGY